MNSLDRGHPGRGTEGLGVGPSPGENSPMGQGDNTTGGPSGSTRDKSTKPGLKVESKKIVTKRGLVAPSPENPKRVEEFVPASDRARTSDVPPSAVVAKTTARFGSAVPKPTGAGLHRNDQVRHEDSNSSADSDLHLDATRELATDPQAAERPLSHPEAAAMEGYRRWAPEDFTPSEGSSLDEELERSRFRTEPGGGKNRVSGGRLQAKAYVSPVTVKPGTGNTPITAAIKVHDIVENAVRAYQTEPSLLRRRLSSLPPKPGESQERWRVLAGGAVAIILLGAVIFWITWRGAERVAPVRDVPLSAGTKGDTPSASQESLRTTALGATPKPLGQTDDKAAGSADPTEDSAADPKSRVTSEAKKPKAVPSAPSPKTAAPATTPVKKPPATSSPAPAPSAPSAKPPKKNDLWLE